MTEPKISLPIAQCCLLDAVPAAVPTEAPGHPLKISHGLPHGWHTPLVLCCQPCFPFNMLVVASTVCCDLLQQVNSPTEPCCLLLYAAVPTQAPGHPPRHCVGRRLAGTPQDHIHHWMCPACGRRYQHGADCRPGHGCCSSYGRVKECWHCMMVAAVAAP